MFLPLEQLADNIWIFPCDDDPQVIQPNVGVIVTGDKTILVNAGNSPKRGKQINDSLTHHEFPSVAAIIYTHHHWDHVFGAMAFPSAQIIAHQLCATALTEAAENSWNINYLREESYRNPLLESRNEAISHLIDDWRSFRICLPNMTFNRTLTFYEDDLTLKLEHIGGPHAPDSILVRVEEAGVTFLGDVLDPPVPYEKRQDDDAQLEAALLDQILMENGKYYIDGCSVPMSQSTMQQIVDNLKQQLQNENS